MISAGEFRRGITFEKDGDVYQILEFQHVKTGRGGAFVRTKIKSVLTGIIKDETFNSTEKFKRAHIETREMQYLYADDSLYYFMDPDTYEQLPIDNKIAHDAIQYLEEGDNATVRFYEGRIFEVESPNFVELEITSTEPGIKGDTTSGATKPATVSTGLTLNVPLFVDNGDIIKIDTRTGEYMSRI
ncbi:MAG TPA: elongation factor P [Tissierellaceae bacterium]|nr:elongation factor P [Tissierellaceae bacterium]